MSARPQRRRLAMVVGAIAVVVVVVLPALRWVAERQVAARLADVSGRLGLVFAAESLSVGLLTGVRFDGFSVADNDGAMLVRCGHVEVGLGFGGAWPPVPQQFEVDDCVAYLRLVDDKPAQIERALAAWRSARPAAQLPADAPSTDQALAWVPGLGVTLTNVVLNVSAKGGTAAPLDGLKLQIATARRHPFEMPVVSVEFAGPVAGFADLLVAQTGASRRLELRAAAPGLQPTQGLIDALLSAGHVPLRVGAVRLGGVAVEQGAQGLSLALSDVRVEDVAPSRRTVAAASAQGKPWLDYVSVDSVRVALPDRSVHVRGFAAAGSDAMALVRAVGGAALDSSALGNSALDNSALDALAAVELSEGATWTAALASLEVDAIGLILVGGGHVTLAGVHLQAGGLDFSVGSLDARRNGLVLLGKRGPISVRVLRPRLSARVKSGRLGRLEALLKRAPNAGANAAAGPPPSAKRPLWSSNPNKMPPATARFAAPVAALPARLAAAVAALGSLRGRIGKLPLRLDLTDGSVELRLSSGVVAVRRIGVGLEPNAKPRLGRLSVGFDLEALGRPAGHVEGSLVLDAATAPILASVSLEGAALVGVFAALDPRIGVGAAPALDLDLTLVALPAGAGEIRFGLSSSELGVDWWRLAERKVTDIALQVHGALRWPADAREWTVAIGELRFGPASNPDASKRARAAGWVRLHGLPLPAKSPRRAARAPSPIVDLSFWLPEQDCGALLAALPPALLPTVGLIAADGPLSGWLDLRINVAHPWYSELDFGLDDERCTLHDAGKLNLAELAGDFVRPANEDGRLRADQPIGPASGAWIPLAQMPRWLAFAMTSTEDGAFWQHRGLNAFLLNRAIRLDLHVGRFVYGGSTITQQLAKNLFFRRTKVLSRKIEEALATWLLERQLGKRRILEIYANAVEMAPDRYGVVRGAETYFGKPATALTPLEAVWLGILKPCPRCAYAHFRAGVIPVWYQIRALEILTRMQRTGVITDAQYEAERNRPPQFVGWSEEKRAVRYDHPIPVQREKEPKRLQRGR